MRKKGFVILAAAALSVAAALPAFASGWQQGADGRYLYGISADNSQKCTNGWYWILSADGVSMKCYYFDANGYMLANTTTPDGYQVNADGQWVKDNAIVAISPQQGQPVLWAAGFDYTPYLMTVMNGVPVEKYDTGRNDDSMSDPQLDMYRQELVALLDQSGYTYSYTLENDGNTDVTLWDPAFKQHDADVQRRIPSRRKTWNDSTKPKLKRLAQNIAQKHEAYEMNGATSLHLITADTETELLSFEERKCVYDYVEYYYGKSDD